MHELPIIRQLVHLLSMLEYFLSTIKKAVREVLSGFVCMHIRSEPSGEVGRTEGYSLAL
jgi:hypothetical protein